MSLNYKGSESGGSDCKAKTGSLLQKKKVLFINHVCTVFISKPGVFFLSRVQRSLSSPFKPSPQLTPEWFSSGTKMAVCWCLPWAAATSVTQRGEYQQGCICQRRSLGKETLRRLLYWCGRWIHIPVVDPTLMLVLWWFFNISSSHILHTID